MTFYTELMIILVVTGIIILISERRSLTKDNIMIAARIATCYVVGFAVYIVVTLGILLAFICAYIAACSLASKIEWPEETFRVILGILVCCLAYRLYKEEMVRDNFLYDIAMIFLKYIIILVVIVLVVVVGIIVAWAYGMLGTNVESCKLATLMHAIPTVLQEPALLATYGEELAGPVMMIPPVLRNCFFSTYFRVNCL